MEQIRRVNRLLPTDTIFLRPFLMVPVAKDSPHYPKDPEAIIRPNALTSASRMPSGGSASTSSSIISNNNNSIRGGSTEPLAAYIDERPEKVIVAALPLIGDNETRRGVCVFRHPARLLRTERNGNNRAGVCYLLCMQNSRSGTASVLGTAFPVAVSSWSRQTLDGLRCHASVCV